MYCPHCGTRNEDTATTCANPECGRPLPRRTPARPRTFPQPAPRPADALSSAVTLGGLSGVIGGGLALLGWFLPWTALGDLVNVGNGPQLILGIGGAALLGGGLAGMVADGGLSFLIYLLALGAIALLLIVPVKGFLAARDGWLLFEKRNSASQSSVMIVMITVDGIRGRLKTIVILMAFSFVLAAIIGGGAGLGSGFWLTSFGSLGGFLGARYAVQQLVEQRGSLWTISPARPATLPPAAAPEHPLLSNFEHRVLYLLADGNDNLAMAAKLDTDPMKITLTVDELRNKLGATDQAQLLAEARRLGLLAPK